jgi:hypothetical protein
MDLLSFDSASALALEATTTPQTDDLQVGFPKIANSLKLLPC